MRWALSAARRPGGFLERLRPARSLLEVPSLFSHEAMRRAGLAPYRLVHATAALMAACERGEVRSVLSAGCGTGITEAHLAYLFPRVHFVLTDLDGSRFWRTAEDVRRLRLKNLEFRPWNVLDVPFDRFDFVMAIELLEHIEADGVAARHLWEASRHFVYAIVPFASEAEERDPELQRREWEKNQHHRPGYSKASFARLFPEAQPVFVRNCYYAASRSVRDEWATLGLEKRVQKEAAWYAKVAEDVCDAASEGREAATGVEVLCRRP